MILHRNRFLITNRKLYITLTREYRKLYYIEKKKERVTNLTTTSTRLALEYEKSEPVGKRKILY